MSAITEVLELITDDTLDSMSKVVYDNGWQESGGVIKSYANALGTFKSLLGELREAATEGLLEAMPASQQRTIADRLANIVTHIRDISNGNQHVPNFTDQVDALHVILWTGGFRYKGKKLVGYEQKYAQVKQLAKEIERIKEREAKAQTLLQAIQVILNTAQTTANEFEAARLNAINQISEISTTHASALTTNTSIDTQVASIEAKLRQAADSAAGADASAQAADAHSRRLQAFTAKVDADEQRLADSVTKAATELAQYSQDVETFKTKKTEELDAFQNRLQEIEREIRNKLGDATSARLFKTFQEREGKISGKEWLWAAAVTASIGVGITSWFLASASGLPDIIFYSKLSLSIPVGVLVGFALQQYGKEPRLKEEYAFKAAISFSLNAYRELVEEALEKLTPEEKAARADFLVQSINIIFDSPTERVFGSRRVTGISDTKLIAHIFKTAKDTKGLFDGK